jgi:hypothetical protein
MAPFQMRFGLGISPSRTYDEEEEDEDDEEEEFDEEEDMEEAESDGTASPTPLQSGRAGGLVGAVVSALRRSLVMCGAGVAGDDDSDSSGSEDDDGGMEIGGPVDVRHVAHVTFDRFGGFLGLPADLEPDVPRPTPSVRSASPPLLSSVSLCQPAVVWFIILVLPLLLR